MSQILDNDEALISFAEAADLFPRHTRGRKVHSSTVWRWCKNGANGVPLEYVMIGSRMFTSREAVKRWIRAQTEAALASGPQVQAPRPRVTRSQTPAQSERAQADARQRLARHGITYGG